MGTGQSRETRGWQDHQGPQEPPLEEDHPESIMGHREEQHPDIRYVSFIHIVMEVKPGLTVGHFSGQ